MNVLKSALNILLMALCLLTFSALNSAALDDPIKRIKGATPKRGVFAAAKRNKALVFKTAKDAEAHFEAAELKKLTALVDFDKQIVLLFAWRGSGQDKLTFQVAESFPEQITFSYKRGRTKDLRSHVYIFVLRKNVTWNNPN